MNLLPDSELAQLRAEAAYLLPDRCDVLRSTDTETSGGISHDWATVTTGIACRLAAVSYQATEGDVGGRLVATSSWVLTVPAETDIRVTDRVSVTVRSNPARTFEVVSGGGHSFEITRQVGLDEIT